MKLVCLPEVTSMRVQERLPMIGIVAVWWYPFNLCHFRPVQEQVVGLHMIGIVTVRWYLFNLCPFRPVQEQVVGLHMIGIGCDGQSTALYLTSIVRPLLDLNRTPYALCVLNI